jgi:type IV pilus assembly protein PilC
MRVLCDNITHPGLRTLLAGAADAVEQGATLPEALENNGLSLRPSTTAIISDAETRGELPRVLSGLAGIAKLDELFSKELGLVVTRASLTLLGGLTLGTMLLWVWLPVLRKLQMNGGLLWPGNEVLWMIDFLRLSYWWVSGGFLCLAFAVLLLTHTASSRILIAKVCWHLPIVSPFVVNIEMAKFCRYLGIIADSNIATTRALDLLPITTLNPFFQSILLHVRADLLDGDTLTQSLRRYSDLPASLAAIIDQENILGPNNEDFYNAIRPISLLALYYEDRAKQASSTLTKATWRITLTASIVFLVWLALVLAPAWRLVLFNMANP